MPVVSRENNISYLTNSESNSIKGLLMFLIILGHNMVFTDLTDHLHVMNYLYRFHIQAFFILPFMYGSKPLTIYRLKTYFVRMYTPFILLTAVMWIAKMLFAESSSPDILSYLKMLLFGNSVMIKEVTGVQIFWFFPAMFVVLLLKDAFYNYGRTFKIVVVSASLLLNIVSVCNPGLISSLEMIVPFAITKGVIYAIYGIAVRYILDKNRPICNTKILWCAVFTLLTLFFAIYVRLYYHNRALTEMAWFETIRTVVWIVFPIAFIMMLYAFRHGLNSIRGLSSYGSYTLPIYVTSPFVGYALYFIFVHYSVAVNVWSAVIAQTVIVLVSFAVAYILYNEIHLRRVLFPKNWEDFKQCLKHN